MLAFTLLIRFFLKLVGREMQTFLNLKLLSEALLPYIITLFALVWT